MILLCCSLENMIYECQAKAFCQSGSTSLASILGKEDKTVRSTRLLERRSKRRKVPKSNALLYENPRSRPADVRGRLGEGLYSDNPLRLFLAGPETRQLLTFQEESELIVQVQVFI